MVLGSQMRGAGLFAVGSERGEVGALLVVVGILLQLAERREEVREEFLVVGERWVLAW
jgi:hypothetical protein